MQSQETNLAPMLSASQHKSKAYPGRVWINVHSMLTDLCAPKRGSHTIGRIGAGGSVHISAQHCPRTLQKCWCSCPVALWAHNGKISSWQLGIFFFFFLSLQMSYPSKKQTYFLLSDFLFYLFSWTIPHKFYPDVFV